MSKTTSKHSQRLIPCIVAYCFGSQSAWAASADLFDGAWLSIQESATINKNGALDWSTTGPWAPTATTYKADSGKNKCFLHVMKSTTQDFAFDLKTFCNVSGVWEKIGQVNLWDLSLKGAAMIGTDWASIYVAQNGISTKTPSAPWLGYEGQFSLTAKLNKNGAISSVTASNPAQGMFYLSDASTSITGTAKGTYKIAWVPLNTMQSTYPGAIQCQNESDSVNGSLPTELCN